MPYLATHGIRFESSSLRRQLPLRYFRIHVTEGDERYLAIFGFDLDRLMPDFFGLFKPDAFRRFDDLAHVRVESTPDHDVDAGLVTFHVRGDADKRQSLGFFLIAYVGTQHLPGNDPSFVLLAEVVEESDPLFAWDLSAKHGDLLTERRYAPTAWRKAFLLAFIVYSTPSTLRWSGMRTINTGHLA